MRLAGERVVLRHSRPDEAGALARGFQEDPTLGEMLGLEPENETEEWLRSMIEKDAREREAREAFWFTIADLRSDEPLGEIGLVGVNWDHRRSGLSIFMLPDARRRGLAREAMELLVSWGHEELELHRIELLTLPHNEPMRALAKAAGFSQDGVLRDYERGRGGFVSNVVYSRLPGE